MNNLNSIIVEGELAEDPTMRGNHSLNDCSCLFRIQTHRYVKVNGESRKETNSFSVITFSGVAESCIIHLRKGRGVRIVGRLVEKQSNDAEYLPLVYITAEHVEIKPMTKAS